MTRAARLRRRASRRFYRVLFGLYRALFRTRVGPAPVDPRGLRRVLVLANYFVGDVVVATPALGVLRRAAPGARVDVLTSPRAASLLAGDPRVDRVLVHDGKGAGLGGWVALAWRLRRERYDLVADFVLPHHLREGLLTAWVAGRNGARVTPHRPARVAGLFTHRGRVPGFERRYMADRLLHAVQAAVAPGAPGPGGAGTADPALFVRPDAAARVADRLARVLGERPDLPVVAFNAWASDPVRSLATDQAAAVAAAIVERHPELAVVLTPPPGAEHAAAAIVAAARARLAPPAAARVAAAPASPDLGDLVALVARAAAVLTPDTANLHVAAALDRPSVGLYTRLGGTKLAHWAPGGPRHRVVHAGDRPLAQLPPGVVADAFDLLWTGRTRAHTSAAGPRPAEMVA